MSDEAKEFIPFVIGFVIFIYLFAALSAAVINVSTLATQCSGGDKPTGKIWIANPVTAGLTGECK